MLVIDVIGRQVLGMNEANNFRIKQEKKSPCQFKNKNIYLVGMWEFINKFLLNLKATTFVIYKVTLQAEQLKKKFKSQRKCLTLFDNHKKIFSIWVWKFVLKCKQN